jgi:outer membrane protein OmpA-like peptidoglycan-associated protein
VDGGPFAYYFVDDVSLWRTGTVEGCDLHCPDAITAAPLEVDSATSAPQWPLVLHFEVNDHVPGDDLLPTVEELFAVLAKNPALRVRVEGHTDDTGNTYANMKLAERRALAVREELVRLGLPRKRFTLVVLGSAEPIATNTTEEGRALNRRVEIELVGTE